MGTLSVRGWNTKVLRFNPKDESLADQMIVDGWNHEPMTNVIDSAKTIAVCTAELESARTGQPVEASNDF